MEQKLTPAQEAKAFAERNGFEIKPNARRYRITRKDSDVTIAEVGGYPAALNAMRTQVAADRIVGAADSGVDAVIANDGTVHIPNRVVDVTAQHWRTKTVPEIAADMVEGAKMMGATPEQAVAVCKRLSPPEMHDYFEQADEATRERIRQRARRPYRITYQSPSGLRIEAGALLGYRTRDEALKDVRRMMSGINGAAWRKMAVSIDYKGV